ncbi:MAG TPA: ATP-binding protein [Ktedonobacteraceae bacterium]|nr:ATP-binding protein [Ktedonobacteraceae bacterium]
MKNEKATKKQSRVFVMQESKSTGNVGSDDSARNAVLVAGEQSQQEDLREQTSNLSLSRPGLLARLRSWFAASTFAPAWLPESLQYPIWGYLVALLLQVVALLCTLYLDKVFHAFAFVGAPSVVAIAMVALSWGVGPSVVATFIGACFLDYVILPPQFSWSFIDPGDVYQLLLFILVGLAISIVASQTERARRRAERLADSLTKEHARLEAIIETVPDVIAIYDKRGRMIQMNELGRHSKIFDPEMKNRSLEELVRLHNAFTLSGEPVGVAELPMMHALRGETVESMEVRFFDSTGSERFISISAAPMRNIRGKIDGVVSITRDLSALHQSEREAADRAMELEATLQSLADALFVVSDDGQIIRSNAVFREIIGLTDQNRESFFALSLEERHATLQMRDEQGNTLTRTTWPETRILRGEILKGPTSMDVQIHNLSGRELQLSVSGAPLYNREGKPVAALCICHDVTERRILEQRTHDALYALLTMAESLVARDREDVLEEAGKTNLSKKIALRMVRLTSRVLGCSRSSIFLADSTGGFLLPVASFGLSSDIESFPIPVSDKRPSQLLARFHAGEVILLDKRAELFDEVGQELSSGQTVLVAPMNVGEHFIGLLVLGQNDPDYVYTKEDIALTAAVAQLLSLVFERERLLRERSEAQATELALRTANQRMEEFLGMVSHELKTPLTSIKGNTQLAIRQLRNSMQQFERIVGLYESAEQQSRRLNRLVDDLLDVSRSQAGHLELIPGPFDLREIVHEALQEQQKMWLSRRIELEMNEEEPLPLNADTDRIAQVISNYLTNALKYSDPDQPVLVSVRREDRYVYLAVRDYGPGLPQEEQGRIWQRFHRVPGIEVRSSSHTSQSGLGLGLYITKTIIEGQHGEVGVESSPGKGSTFWFRLPLRQENSENQGN